jgi:multidrug resistance efflux pump
MSGRTSSLARGKLEQAQRQAADKVANAENAVVKAQEDLVKTQAGLNTVLAGPDSLDMALKRNAVETSRLALEGVQQALDQAILRAPFDGRVASVGAKVGDRVTAATVMVQLVSTSYLVQAQVDETQIASVKVGQPVQLSFDALSQSQQRPLSGRISAHCAAGHGGARRRQLSGHG